MPRHSLRRQEYATLELAGKKPGAGGKTHLLSVSSASASRVLCPVEVPLDPTIATLVTFPSASTSNESVVTPSAPVLRASAG